MTRPPPAFQCYASDWLAKEHFKLASLNERGLLWTMLNQVWVSESLPENPEELAVVLGLQKSDVLKALTPRVKLPFESMGNGRMICPELKENFDNYARQRENKSKAGKAGADERWQKRRGNGAAITPPSTAVMAAPELKGDAMSCAEAITSEPLKTGNVSDTAPLSDADEAAYQEAFEATYAGRKG